MLLWPIRIGRKPVFIGGVLGCAVGNISLLSGAILGSTLMIFAASLILSGVIYTAPNAIWPSFLCRDVRNPRALFRHRDRHPARLPRRGFYPLGQPEPGVAGTLAVGIPVAIFVAARVAGRKRNRSARADGKTNQKMGKKLQYKRLLMLTLLLAAAFAGLGYRLVDLQVLQHDELSQEAQNNTHYTYRLEPRRGDILDDKGNLLATSVFVKTVFADPMLIGNHQAEVAHAIAPLLQLNENELVAETDAKNPHRMTRAIPYTNRYVVLKRKVSTDVWEKIRQTMDKLTFGVNEKHLPKKEQAFYRDLREKGICTDPVDDQLRVYPNGSLAAHVLGFVGTTERTNSSRRAFPGDCGQGRDRIVPGCETEGRARLAGDGARPAASGSGGICAKRTSRRTTV